MPSESDPPDEEPEPVVELMAQRMPSSAGPALGGGPEANKHREALARLATDLIVTTHRLGKRLRKNLGDDVPDEGWVLSYAQYSRTILGLLGDERERVKLLAKAKESGVPELDDAQFGDELRKLALEAIRDLPQGDLDAALLIRQNRLALPGRKRQQ